jgi:hypothetical protein
LEIACLEIKKQELGHEGEKVVGNDQPKWERGR